MKEYLITVRHLDYFKKTEGLCDIGFKVQTEHEKILILGL